MEVGIAFAVGICIAAAVVGIGSRFIFTSLNDDNPIEEVAEQIIESQTGISIDLTPESSEEVKKVKKRSPKKKRGRPPKIKKIEHE